jgi:hypothetical protein
VDALSKATDEEVDMINDWDKSDYSGTPRDTVLDAVEMPKPKYENSDKPNCFGRFKRSALCHEGECAHEKACREKEDNDDDA